MKTILRLTFFLSIIFIVSSCFLNRKQADNGIRVYTPSDAVVPTEGTIVYGLPRTVFTVVVGMERTIEKPGPYSSYAGDMLGLKNVMQNESESWSINSIKVISHDELDPSEFYIIKSSTLFTSNVLTLKKEGLILDLNPAIFNSSIALNTGVDGVSGQFQSFDLGSDEYYRLQRDTAYKRVNVDSTFIRIPYIVEKKKSLTTEQLAEKAAKRLLELRDGKHLILTGEATVFPQSDAPIKEINRLEKEYTELFTGKTIKESRTFTFQIIPVKEMSGKPVTLFQYSDLTGPVTGTNKGGKPVNLEFLPEQKTKDLVIIKNEKVVTEAPVYDKLFYRVPDVVNLKISTGSEVLFNSRKLIYQFGEVIQLPANYIIGK